MNAIDAIAPDRSRMSWFRFFRKVVVCGVVLMVQTTLSAQTVTTILNESPYQVPFQLKWASADYASDWMVLQPGWNMRFSSPNPADVLFVRFNGNLNQGQMNLRETRLQTAVGVPDYAPGLINSFREVGYGIVDIRAIPNQGYMNPPSQPPMQAPRPAPPRVVFDPRVPLNEIDRTATTIDKMARPKIRDTEKGINRIMKGQFPW